MSSACLILFSAHLVVLGSPGKHHRSVFRGLISAGICDEHRPSIELTDRMIERSATVEIVLDILYSSRDTAGIPATQLLNVVAFADKYDMEGVRKHVAIYTKCILPTLLAQGHVPTPSRIRLAWAVEDREMLGSILNNLRWCFPTTSLTTLARAEQWGHDVPNKSLTTNNAFPCRERHLRDPSEFTYAEFLMIPPSLIWIMLRATNMAARAKEKQRHPPVYKEEELFSKAYAQELKRLLTLACM